MGESPAFREVASCVVLSLSASLFSLKPTVPETGLCKVRTEWRMSVRKNVDGKMQLENAGDKMRMTNCGWKIACQWHYADDKIPMREN